MSKPVIITCAVTGGIHTPTMSPHLPITPAEIAESAIGAAEAGGVNEFEDGAPGAEALGDVVACGAGLVAGYGAVVAEKTVEEGGFADVGFPGDGDYGRGEEFAGGLPAGQERAKAILGRVGAAGVEKGGYLRKL